MEGARRARPAERSDGAHSTATSSSHEPGGLARFPLGGHATEPALDLDDTVVLVAETILPNRAQACIIAVTGPGVGRRYPLSDEALIVGRSPEADIRVDEPGVSRKHAIIIPGPLGCLVEDLNSTNGTQVEGASIDGRHLLLDGETLQVGTAVFKFLESHNIEQAYYDEVFRLTATDELTGIYNRRYLFESLERELARATRNEHDLALVLFDVDHFKNLNDSYGHVAGDHVLAGIAKRAGTLCRAYDVLARYGGEEFAVLLPECAKAEGAAMAERVRAAIGGRPFEDEGRTIPVTISLGVACVTEVDISGMRARGVPVPEQVRALVQLADQRLYQAKAGGRNRVVS